MITNPNFPSKIQYNLKLIYLSGNCTFIMALEYPGQLMYHQYNNLVV